MQFFLLERTSGPVLTFKNLCGGFSGKGLNLVLSNFEPLGFSFITFFFQTQELSDWFLNRVQFHVHIAHSFYAKHYVGTKFYNKLKQGV